MNDSAQSVKATIRKSIRQIRQTINQTESLNAANQICENLLSIEHYTASRNIASFLSFDGEVSTRIINQRLLDDKRIFYLPKLKPWPPNRLWFMPFYPDVKMTTNQFNIPEVDLPVSQAIRPSRLDILLMPLVAFDTRGNRLGMGGGFYDASLAHLKESNIKPLCLGLAYEVQKVADLPSEPWDFQLDGVITEKQVYWF
ncbi:5-formyltetrahydrofolate cyclo-ligase [Aliikangiella marina]|uniref:5-formyltetrahydrofolate cyclo-ligase n=1 Tax=Aliikangiella marina TaxID=1712262 RepID=A0A545T1B6_9GAMM|nr:5-formyltetrahydrofolate cyclo-ligase [Aliikangiella marina]TQV71017.1 5-formyltetrahydrofolate cyclo-ligase [Aliikangiella marina]